MYIMGLLLHGRGLLCSLPYIWLWLSCAWKTSSPIELPPRCFIFGFLSRKVSLYELIRHIESPSNYTHCILNGELNINFSCCMEIKPQWDIPIEDSILIYVIQVCDNRHCLFPLDGNSFIGWWRFLPAKSWYAISYNHYIWLLGGLGEIFWIYQLLIVKRKLGLCFRTGVRLFVFWKLLSQYQVI
jgi:hypothetical protein